MGEETFAFGQVKMPHGLTPEAAGYLGPRACYVGSQEVPIYGELSHIYEGVRGKNSEPGSYNRKIRPVKITEKEPTVWKINKVPVHTHKMRRELSNKGEGTSLVAQWIRLHAPNAGGPGSIPGQGTRSHMQATTKEPACRN